MDLFDNISVSRDSVIETEIVSENGVPRIITREIGRLSGMPFDNNVRDIRRNIVGKMIGGRFEHWPGRPLRWP